MQVTSPHQQPQPAHSLPRPDQPPLGAPHDPPPPSPLPNTTTETTPVPIPLTSCATTKANLNNLILTHRSNIRPERGGEGGGRVKIGRGGEAVVKRGRERRSSGKSWGRILMGVGGWRWGARIPMMVRGEDGHMYTFYVLRQLPLLWCDVLSVPFYPSLGEMVTLGAATDTRLCLKCPRYNGSKLYYPRMVSTPDIIHRRATPKTGPWSGSHPPPLPHPSTQP